MADIAAYRPLPEFNEVLAALEGRALQRPHAPAALVPMQLYIYHNSSSFSSLFFPFPPFLPFPPRPTPVPAPLPDPLAEYLCEKLREKLREKLEDFFKIFL